jgi:hypothetical protein
VPNSPVPISPRFVSEEVDDDAKEAVFVLTLEAHGDREQHGVGHGRGAGARARGG